MGEPKRLRKKYSKPRHPWQKQRIEEETQLQEEYGLKNKTEIWKTRSKLKTVSDRAKKLIASRTKQAEIEQQQLLQRLNKLGLIKENATIDEVLGLQLKDFFERRIQTIIFRKGLAKTLSQARQFITHKHIKIENKTITSPSYLVGTQEELKITFSTDSTLNNPEHPERTQAKKQ